MTLVGGLGTVFGPVVGAFVIIVGMQQYLSGLRAVGDGDPGHVMFVVCVLTFRRGIIGEIAHLPAPVAVNRRADLKVALPRRHKAVDDRSAQAGALRVDR